ncbi:hypothetical protein SAQ01S_22380 [Sphingomonas aquatilis NBRC 16722]|nr:hypothetical protein SAQ01S_22380 [Sphingomonas aquatilis NBRC 16722]
MAVPITTSAITATIVGMTATAAIVATIGAVIAANTAVSSIVITAASASAVDARPGRCRVIGAAPTLPAGGRRDAGSDCRAIGHDRGLGHLR